MKDIGTAIIDVMCDAEKHGFSISEITLSETQRDWLATVYCFSVPKPPLGKMVFNGAQVRVLPPKQTPGQKAAAELRALADKLEKQ